VIEVALDLIISLQRLRELFTVLSRDAVDDSAFAFKPSSEQLHDIIVDRLEGLLVSDLVDKVWTIER